MTITLPDWIREAAERAGWEAHNVSYDPSANYGEVRLERGLVGVGFTFHRNGRGTFSWSVDRNPQGTNLEITQAAFFLKNILDTY